jgi:hypothetical protein
MVPEASHRNCVIGPSGGMPNITCATKGGAVRCAVLLQLHVPLTSDGELEPVREAAALTGGATIPADKEVG